MHGTVSHELSLDIKVERKGYINNQFKLKTLTLFSSLQLLLAVACS